MFSKIVFILAVFSTLTQAANFGVGQRDFIYVDKDRNRNLATHVWYPIDPKIKLNPIIQKGNPFAPVISAKNAPLSKSPLKFSLVLLSHGSGGKADKLFWLTDHLVRNGYIVLAVDHPGNMTGDNSAEGLMRIWERPKDITFALNRLLEENDFKSQIDLDRVAAVGHSAGGTTALLLGGARLSSAQFTSPIPHCSGTKDPYYARLCEELKSLDLHAFPKALVEGDYRDPRVKALIALDPGMFKSFQVDSLTNLKTKSLIFIADKLNAPQDEIHSKEFLKVFPKNTATLVPGSFHMTFLQACNPDFPKDDPELKELCIENDRKLRTQRSVAKGSLNFLKTAWIESDTKS